jgi:D-inositol-3-phosphate glycosyltransferase
MSVYIRSLALELGRRGHRIDLFTRQTGGRHGSGVAALSDNVRLVQLRAGDNGYDHPSELYPHLPAFFESLEGFRAREAVHYDFIHSHYWLSGRVGNWAGAAWGAPHAVMFHTLGAVKNRFLPNGGEPSLRVDTEAELIRTCHRIIASTPGEKAHLQDFYGADAAKIRVVPCGVDLELFKPLGKGASRRRLGFGLDDAIVLFVGRFSPVKGLERLFHAVGLLREHPKLRLVLVGGEGENAPDREVLESLMVELRIQELVQFADRIEHDRLAPFYSSADLLVLPSHYESFGLVSLEALACGTPVVATPVGAMDQIIIQGETGYVLADGSPAELARCIRSILQRSGPLHAGAEKARKSVEGFSWVNIAAAMESEFLEALHDFNLGEDGRRCRTM